MGTRESAQFADRMLKTAGQPHTLVDGSVVHLPGTLPEPSRNPPGTLSEAPERAGEESGEWSAFSVDKWRSAMFTTRSFFLQLFDDTTEFIAELCERRGGQRKVLLIEIGVGTGEALTPLAKHAK